MTLRRRADLAIATTTLEPRVTWILGSPRSGTTWLTAQLAALTGAVAVDEPLIGAHLAVPMGAVTSLPHPKDPLVYEASEERPAYFFSRGTEYAWRPALRALLLRRFAAAVITSRGGRRAPVLIKEPNGSLAAPLLLRALPRSRLLFVVRDGRDVVDSMVDGASEGWITQTHGSALAPDDRRAFLERRAHHWVRTVDAVRRAFDAHGADRRLLVTYESLRAEPEAEVARIIRWLGRDDVLDAVPGVVASHSFERLPAEHTGSGQFARAATPGLWRESFSQEEQAVLTTIMGPTLATLGYS
jgi:Sulfotransferase family